MTKIILKTIEELDLWKKTLKNHINFVPTMGNLHDGHSRLIKEASFSSSNTTLVSIFINPLQFDNKEDLKHYPKTLTKDIEIGFNSGADALFIPNNHTIFPTNNKNIISLEAAKDLSSRLCGIERLGHFDGVCTVVYRLLELIEPKTLFLGEKDWQQLLIIKKMINLMKLKIQVKSIATQRDYDGVPFSSRNNKLSSKERQKLGLFSKELLNVHKYFQGENTFESKELLKKLKKLNIAVEYLEHVNAFDLQKATSFDNITMLAGAIVCGNTRLIDHVFLMKRKPIIAIDGPAGSGKSTVTKLIAKELNLLYLDTGAMYRALSWFLINERINPEKIDQLNQCLKNLSIIFKSKSNSEQDVYVNNYRVTEKIRSIEISKKVSAIASIGEVREFLVREQRKIGASGGIIAEGRDIGTEVFPKAELKIFLTAGINERAKRRMLELEQKGFGKIDFLSLKDQINKRDLDDSNRKISPLKKASDAIELSTDGFSIKEIVEKIIEIYNNTIPKELQNN